ncbi:MAG: alpha/beta fold hydrolase [Rhodobacteraceae bacterium]|nr:alpha/beta fold hydrolase [Paracoccaceae bacterium]MCY4137959.1 alpha/beta fold hydrolase [Paracoccaceae bacterium]
MAPTFVENFVRDDDHSLNDLSNDKKAESPLVAVLRWSSLVLFAAFVGAQAGANENGNTGQAYFETKVSVGDDENSTSTYFEMDGAIPLVAGNGAAFFVQPGLILSYAENNSRLYGASLGSVYRFKAAAGIVGVNAFYDWNSVKDMGRRRVHQRVGLGVDYQSGRSHITANYYHPLSNEVRWESGSNQFVEYAAGGPELRYKFALDDHWALSGRALYEIDPGSDDIPGATPIQKRNAWQFGIGGSYRIGCTSIGLEVEHDTRRDETRSLLSVALSFRAKTSTWEDCTDRKSKSLLAFVDREKIIRPRFAVTPIAAYTVLPDDVTKLFSMIEGGDPDGEEVWLIEQGGPELSLDVPVEDLMNFPGHASKILVAVHQVQTYNPGIFRDARLNSLERAQTELDVSVEILDRVIRHFKAKGKKVVVVGHSFGAFITTRYLVQKGPSAADRYVIMAGRLDIEKTVYEDHLNKLNDGTPFVYEFEYPGGNKQLVKRFFDESELTQADRLTAVFNGIVGRDRYTRLLADTDLSKVIYVYGTQDQLTGSLEPAEITFLNDKGAEVIAIQGGDHDSMFAGTVPRQIVDLIND